MFRNYIIRWYFCSLLNTFSSCYGTFCVWHFLLWEWTTRFITSSKFLNWTISCFHNMNTSLQLRLPLLSFANLMNVCVCLKHIMSWLVGEFWQDTKASQQRNKLKQRPLKQSQNQFTLKKWSAGSHSVKHNAAL
jgi:hypothetical protein